MLKLDAVEAYEGLIKYKSKSYRFPNQADPRYRSGGLYPDISPKFTFNPRERIFTMGSCFAREIESQLVERGFEVPVAGFSVPPAEMTPSTQLLNEYNFGTMAQRIQSLITDVALPDEAGIEETSEGVIDLFLHIGSSPVSSERLSQRREEIRQIYRNINICPVVIITLGLIESWYDEEFRCYINRAPSYRWAKRHPGRFTFRRLDLGDLLTMTNEFILPLAAGGRKVLLTVSPIPLETSFQTGDIITSNCYGKSTLRVVAEECKRNWPTVDYFPSYEIATSFGTAGFNSGNVHLQREVVSSIVGHMLENYLSF
jgi:hypothetical protein